MTFESRTCTASKKTFGKIFQWYEQSNQFSVRFSALRIQSTAPTLLQAATAARALARTPTPCQRGAHGGIVCLVSKVVIYGSFMQNDLAGAMDREGAALA